jgi:hypothetical protein
LGVLAPACVCLKVVIFKVTNLRKRISRCLGT